MWYYPEPAAKTLRGYFEVSAERDDIWVPLWNLLGIYVSFLGILVRICMIFWPQPITRNKIFHLLLSFSLILLVLLKSFITEYKMEVEISGREGVHGVMREKNYLQLCFRMMRARKTWKPRMATKVLLFHALKKMFSIFNDLLSSLRLLLKPCWVKAKILIENRMDYIY